MVLEEGLTKNSTKETLQQFFCSKGFCLVFFSNSNFWSRIAHTLRLTLITSLSRFGRIGLILFL